MVRRAYDLYPRVWAFENLLWAERAAARGKRGRPDVAAFEYRLEDELVRLRDELCDKTYRPGPYRRHTIREPKERVISAAPFRDRVVHHALCRVIEPLFERRFIADSYACRLGKGTHAALYRCTALARRYPYVLRCDVVQFFPSMDHAVLRERLGRVVGDPDALWLCDLILANGIHLTSRPLAADWQRTSRLPPSLVEGRGSRGSPGGELIRHHQPTMSATGVAASPLVGEKGLPIGNQTSQFWANVYLDALDQFVKRELRCHGYIRYVDDFLLFAGEKAPLHRWKQEIIGFLDANLRLRLHERESTVFPVANGIPFLGFRVYPDHRWLRRRNGVGFARRHQMLLARYAAGEVDFAHVTASVRGWVAHASHGDTYRLRRSLLRRRVVAPAWEVARAGA